MAIQFGVALHGAKELVAKFSAIPGALDVAEQRAVRRSSLEALALFRRKTSGEVLHKRTTAYASSTNAAAPSKDAQGWKAEVGVKKGPAEKYAAVHEGDEHGNPITIRPKHGRLLTIPLDDNLTSAGVARFKSPLEFRSRGGFWLPFNGKVFFVIPTSGGKRSKTGGLEFLFEGVTKVTIPARAPLRHTGEEMRPRVREIVNEEIAGALRRVA